MSCRTLAGHMSILVTTTNTGTLSARARPRCSVDGDGDGDGERDGEGDGDGGVHYKHGQRASLTYTAGHKVYTQWVQHLAVLQNEAQHYGIVDAISYPTIQTDWMYIA